MRRQAARAAVAGLLVGPGLAEPRLRGIDRRARRALPTEAGRDAVAPGEAAMPYGPGDAGVVAVPAAFGRTGRRMLHARAAAEGPAP